MKKRKPTLPGTILEEYYIKTLNLNLQELANPLGISRNTLFKIRFGISNVTPALAIALAEASDTTLQLWLNLQQKYDLWVDEYEKPHEQITPIYKAGTLLPFPTAVSHRMRATS